MSEPTYWNGQPCAARRVRVIVADHGRFARPWFRRYVGTERAAVEISRDDEVFYLDDENGAGWDKVTWGKGSSLVGHRSLDVERVVE